LGTYYYKGCEEGLLEVYRSSLIAIRDRFTTVKGQSEINVIKEEELFLAMSN